MLKSGLVVAWALMSALVIMLITLPISLETQFLAGMVVLIAMMALKLLRPDGIWRLVSLAFGTAIVLRYAYWRTTSTLPPLNQPENFIPGILLYAAEMYSVMMLALSVFVVARPLPPRPSRAAKLDRLPGVDVFIPTYNEDAALARQHDGGRHGHGLSGRQGDGLAARRRLHHRQAQRREARRRDGGRRAPCRSCSACARNSASAT